MTTVTVDSSSDILNLDSIPIIDMRFLSQSDLNSLSLCSNESFDLRRCDEIVIPKIDRSIFNESAGSRKQTYSRLRLAPRKPEITSIGSRRRSGGLLPIPKPTSEPIDDPEQKENTKIVYFLQQLFAKNKSKTLNTRKNSNLINLGSTVDLEKFPVVNRNGVVVDIAGLGNLGDPFGPELKRRTVGLETEADLLGYLRGLEGLWGSRRKKRKVVDASDFGDFLPIGWNLLLSLKRKEGRFSLFCRRYISPNGLQFKSCKEVSSYLLSLSGPQDESQPNSGNGFENINVVSNLASGSASQRRIEIPSLMQVPSGSCNIGASVDIAKAFYSTYFDCQLLQ
ncbi:Methyl-CpG DNA binding [Macleaya cordata]|uniref:Methyl-CpG DNA binding n=1 Tax=Macleaya cordata TaxID=56857 RepID=A0A200QUV0_MACCD|nr:Methyl-CpG DNA binding [Macleaya cordata]